MRKKPTISGRKIWLITCSGPNEKTEVIGMINARRSTTYVKKSVEQKYADRFLSLDERLALALGQWKNPYKVTYANYNSAPHHDWMICGSNPFMEARLVKINGVVDGELFWEEIPHLDTCACWSLMPQIRKSL